VHADRSLSALLDDVRVAQETTLRSVDHRPGCERLVAHARRKGRAREARRFATLATGALALAAALHLLAPRPPDSLALQVDGAPAGAGSWMVAPAAGEVVAHFSDGTTMRLHDEGRARVVDMDATGARVVLERGAIGASVVHRPDARWIVAAGPFDIRVTGTRFSASWDPVETRFVVTLEEGGVAVTGPAWEGERFVRAGETIDVRVSTTDPAPTIAAPPADPPPFAAPSADPPASAAGPAPIARRPAGIERVRALAAEGKFQLAYQLVESVGLAQLEAGADAATTWLLADVCRLSGHATQARDLLQRLRARFPGSSQSSEAAFVMGRMAFDGGRTSEASRWFATYLAERPGGSLAVEARGRMLECVLRTGDADAIRRSAEAYLAVHPQGPHAAIARRARDHGAIDAPSER
jgi:transmembrane sensor